MIDVKKFNPAHLSTFMPESLIPDFNIQMIENHLNGERDMVTLFADGVPIAIAGVNHLRLGVAEGWIIRGQGLGGYKFSFFKTIRRLVDYAIELMEVRRFEIAISHNEPWQKWAEKIGFEYEHTCKNYDPFNKVDHDIYVRLM